MRTKYVRKGPRSNLPRAALWTVGLLVVLAVIVAVTRPTAEDRAERRCRELWRTAEWRYQEFKAGRGDVGEALDAGERCKAAADAFEAKYGRFPNIR